MPCPADVRGRFMPEIIKGHCSYKISRNEKFFARSRNPRDRAEVYGEYTAQKIPKGDDEIAEKDRFSLSLKSWS